MWNTHTHIYIGAEATYNVTARQPFDSTFKYKFPFHKPVFVHLRNVLVTNEYL